MFLWILALIITIIRVSSQSTTLSPSCDPASSILELTGDYSNSTFSISSAIDNCHIYIHDIVATAINIHSTVTNSSITIRNASSANKSIANFIWFGGIISSFLFINISNVSHSSLLIDASASDDWICAVYFARAVAGKPDRTSWISVTGIVMNDVACENTNTMITSNAISVALVHFEQMTDVASVDISKFTMNNFYISRYSSPSTSNMCAVIFTKAVTFVQKISIANFVVRNIQVRTVNGTLTFWVVNFLSSVTAVDPSLLSSSESHPTVFSFREMDFKNISAFALQGKIDVTVLEIQGSMSFFKNVELRSIRVESINGFAPMGSCDVFLSYFNSNVSAPALPTATSLTVDSITWNDISSVGNSTSKISLCSVSEAATNFNKIQFSNITAMFLNSTSTSGNSSVILCSFFSSVSAFVSSSPSTLLIDSIALENISSQGITRAGVYFLYVDGTVYNYNNIHFTNIYAHWLHASATEGDSMLSVGLFRSSVVVDYFSAAISSVLVGNILLRSVTSSGRFDARLRCLEFSGDVYNYSTIRLSNVSATSLQTTAPAGASFLRLFYFYSSVAAPAKVNVSSPWSSMVTDNVHFRNISSSGGSFSSLSMLLPSGPVSNFDHIQFTNINAAELSVYSRSTSSVTIVGFDESIAAPIEDSPSSLQFENVQLVGASSVGVTPRLRLFSVLGFMNRYRKIRLANISAVAVKIESTEDWTMLHVIYFANLSAPSTQAAPSTISVENVRLHQAASVARSSISGSVDVFGFYVRDSVSFYSIQITNVSATNVFASSMSSTFDVNVVRFGGLLSNCRSLRLRGIVLKNVTAFSRNSSFSSTISLLTFPYLATLNNISQISLSNSRIEQVTPSSTKRSSVRIFDCDDANLQAESIIIDGNSLILSSSERLDTSSKDSAAIAGISLVSPGFGKLEITNNILNILSDDWRTKCSPSNCAVVRVNDVQGGSNNTNPSTDSLTLISNNEIVPGRFASFISFASYKNAIGVNAVAPLLNFVVEGNSADFSGSSDSVVSLDSASSPFPSLVFVEVKCNNWPRIVDRTAEHHLMSFASSPAEVHNFANWTCWYTPSSSVSSLQTRSSSISVAPTSVSVAHTSISLMHSISRSPGETVTQPVLRFFVLTVSQPVASALVASDATQAIAVVSIAIFGSISSSPVLGFNVGRQQAMTNFAKKSLEGDCRGLLPATTINEFEEHISNPLGLGDSPTQMSIGGSEKLMSYYVGAVVGDFMLTFGLVLLSQGIGMAVMKYFESKKNINSNLGKLVRDRMGSTKNNNKESTFEMMRRVFATSYVSLTLFFCLSFLLTPILSSSLIVLVAAINDPKLKDHEVGVGLRILCIILAVIFCAVAVYFVLWSVFIRNQRKEKYRILKQDNTKSQNEDKNIGAYLFKAEGEWCYPNPTHLQQQNLSHLVNSSKKNNNAQLQFTLWYHNFLIAEPTFESYRSTIWFCSIEIISAILLAFPPFFAQFSSSGKGSCLVQGAMLLLIQAIYTVLLMWKNPFKLRILRIMNPVLAVQQLVIVFISLIIAGKRSGNDENSESPSWLWKVIIIPLGFQGAMSFLMIGAAFFPFVLFLKKLKGRMTRKDEQDARELRPVKGRNDAPSPQRNTSRRHKEANEVELLSRQRSSSEHDGRNQNRDHRDSRNTSTYNYRRVLPRRENSVETLPKSNRENPYSGNSRSNSRRIEREFSSSAMRNDNRNYNNNDNRRNESSKLHDHRRRDERTDEMPQRNIYSSERQDRRSQHNNINNERSRSVVSPSRGRSLSVDQRDRFEVDDSLRRDTRNEPREELKRYATKYREAPRRYDAQKKERETAREM